MDHNFLSAFILLLLVLDPLGSLPVFIPVMRQVPPQRRRWVAVREVGRALRRGGLEDPAALLHVEAGAAGQQAEPDEREHRRAKGAGREGAEGGLPGSRHRTSKEGERAKRKSRKGSSRGFSGRARTARRAPAG